MTRSEYDKWLVFSLKDVESGGTRCTESEAVSLAWVRANLDGEFPVEYPAIGGGCYVFSGRMDIHGKEWIHD